ncbi:hypothetical protein [Mesorhizobium sp. CAU 1741]|uniref:LGFP repeat-containing protein n=1 Tax=Mesorhizobium sp. CAU 1741 TaxID=3140366 RepID=UPI00325AA43D
MDKGKCGCGARLTRHRCNAKRFHGEISFYENHKGHLPAGQCPTFPCVNVHFCVAQASGFLALSAAREKCIRHLRIGYQSLLAALTRASMWNPDMPAGHGSVEPRRASVIRSGERRMSAIQVKLAQLRANGWTITDLFLVETPLPDGGAMMILPSVPATIFQAPGAAMAFEVHGAILGAYTAQGGPAGTLGYPESDEVGWYDSHSRMSIFQRGVIGWTAAQGTIIHNDKVVHHLGLAAARAYQLLNLATADASATVHREENIAAGVNWCGYALANMMKAGGMDKAHTALFANTQGLLDYGSYYTLDIYGASRPRARVTKMLPSGLDIRDAHSARRSQRRIVLWPEIQRETPLDIAPGDIVLVDHDAGGGPDHIQIVYHWHPAQRVLTTIDGNGGSFVLRSVLERQFGAQLRPNVHFRPAPTTPAAGSAVAPATKQQHLRALDGLDVLWPMPQAGYVSIGCHVLTAAGQVNPPAPTSTAPHSRVFAIIRPSIMDFEHHRYQNI